MRLIIIEYVLQNYMLVYFIRSSLQSHQCYLVHNTKWFIFSIFSPFFLRNMSFRMYIYLYIPTYLYISLYVYIVEIDSTSRLTNK